MVVRKRFIHIERAARAIHLYHVLNVELEQVMNTNDISELANEHYLLMLALFWICRGLRHTSTIQSLCDIYISQKPTIVFLSIVKLNVYDRALYICNSLGFDNVFLVPSISASGGLILCCNKSLDI